MNVNEVYPSKFIKSDDIGHQRLKLQVADVRMEDIADNEPKKPCMYFNGKTKGIVVNKTNLLSLGVAFGVETDMWRGRWIELLAMPTQFNGKTVMGLVTLPIVESVQPAQAGPSGQGALGAERASDAGPHNFPAGAEQVAPGGQGPQQAGPGPAQDDALVDIPF